MTTEQIQKAIKATPFRAFTLRLADQRALHVPHPEYIAHAPGARTAAVTDEQGAFEIIDLLLVVGIEFQANGTPGKKKR